MTVLAIIVAIVLLFIYHTKTSTPIPPEIHISRPDVIEDTSHLKSDLAKAQEQLQKSYKELGQLQHIVSQLSGEKEKLAANLGVLQQSFDKLQHQKKSSEVKTGAISEVLAPVMSEFPFPTYTLKFLGQPVDYISFDYEADQITFVEIKSGKSQFGENQRKIKKMVEQGKVKFATVRIDETGVKVK